MFFFIYFQSNGHLKRVNLLKNPKYSIFQASIHVHSAFSGANPEFRDHLISLQIKKK